MRVLQVAARMFSLANFALPLMERLREEGHEVEALGAYDDTEERIAAAGFQTHSWRLGHSFNPVVILRARRELGAFLARTPYDIVHTHCSFGGIAGNGVARRHARAVVYTQHGFYVHKGLNPLLRRAWLGVEKAGLRHAHRVICVSQAERDLALTLGVGGDGKFVTVPGAGVEVSRFRLGGADREQRRAAIRRSLGLGDEETVLLTVSRLTWDKGYREMIEAARRLRAEGRSFRFLAAGSGKDGDGIAGAVREAGLKDTFLLLGWRDDVVDLYCASDVFVFPSHREGLPISPIEAMASGLPVIASDIPGCCEEVEDGRSGLLFSVGDADALTDALRRVLGDPDLASRLGAAASERAEVFDLKHVLDLQVALYRELAEELG